MTDEEKRIETLKWLDFFDRLRVKVSGYAINDKTFNLGLKGEIEKLREICKNEKS
jgi:hypothetical protein